MLKQRKPVPPVRSSGKELYPHLFSPFQLGRLELSNRAMVPAMTTNFAETDGSVGDSLIGYLVERARGGFGSIVTENIGVHPTGRVMPRMMMASDDHYIPGLRRLASEVHAAGGVLIGQISHAGRQTRSKITGQQLVAPSPIPCPLNREMPRELTIPETEQFEAWFVDAAQRLAEAGFDGIEIHGGHGYLVAGFLSAYSNKRTDAYGGSLLNRMRFVRRIVAGIQQRLGKDFPLLVRISGCEFVPEGLDIEQSTGIANQLHADGVHAISISVGVYESFNKLSMITGEPEGQWLPIAGQIKAATRLPVIGVGRIKRAAVAEKALADGLIDIAAFGRASIADPHMIRKIVEGRERDTIWCLSCNVCLGRSARPETICPVNPLVGRERLVRLQPARRKHDIIIHGTSIAAMTAAWTAAIRGHRVTLVQEHASIGGMQAWRTGVPGQEEYAEVLESVLRRATMAGVRLTRASVEPSGAQIWRTRTYQPVDRQRLDSIAGSVTSYAVLSEGVAIMKGQRVVVIGNDLSAAEAALIAATRLARVFLYISTRTIAVDAHPGYRESDSHRLLERGGTISHETPEFSAGDLVVVGHAMDASYGDPAAWKLPTEPADYLIPDAYEPGVMTSGIYEAFAKALAIGDDSPEQQRANDA